MGCVYSLSQAGLTQMTMCSGSPHGEMLDHFLSRKMETELEFLMATLKTLLSSYLFKIFIYTSKYY